MTNRTCTVTVHGHERCGREAVVAGTFTSGTEWACCDEHATDADRRAAAEGVGAFTGEHRVGDRVQVWRYGRSYDATVTRVGARGAVYATFTYGNGAERTVRV